MDHEARLIHRCALPPRCEHGHFFAPRAYEIDGLERLQGEVFGPVLHVLRFQAQDLDGLIERINALGYGLTFGVHSRIDARIDAITGRIHAGNSYVNRNMIGAVVGVQPFGGEGLSGTGPKAGGPDYLTRFAVERTVSINTAASGGNAALLSMDEDDAGASR
jgi:RHH-type proline utilization regulon transcriptional repressor/proline dehydrogenase/delta 1-pyrroline-5-carboxylate dehydrogenase